MSLRILAIPPRGKRAAARLGGGVWRGWGGGGLGAKTTVPSPRCAATRQGAKDGRPLLGGGVWEGGGVRRGWIVKPSQ